MQVNKFYEEQSKLFENFLSNFIYPNIENNKIFRLELILTPDCNKECKYCYLQKNKDKMYPQETRDLNLILKNLDSLLNYYLKKDLKIRKLDLYSGEIWGSKFANSVFDTILKFIDNGLKINTIIIPSNGSFIFNDEYLSNVEYYINEFHQRKVELCYSLSYDGILDQENRPFNIYTECQEDKIFEFAQKYEFGFHPMISAYGIEKQIDNHWFWVEKMKKYSKNLLIDIMFLEVRDGGTWTKEKIQHYLAWLKVFAEWAIKEEFNNDYLESLMQILRISDNPLGCSYVPFFQTINNNEISCSLTQSLVVRLGDLAVVPCHRLCYGKHIYGKYILKDDEIVGVKGKNVNLMHSNLLLGSSGYLKCDICPFAQYCIKQCQGACFEFNKEPLYPI